jgi:hypothetical protein
MLSDDVFRTRLAATFAELLKVAKALADVAEVSHVETARYVRLSLLPHAQGACPVEIMMRSDQLYDIEIGHQFYEDCPMVGFDEFVPLIEGIAKGDVVQRRHVSVATGAERSVETLVTLWRGMVWQKGHVHTDVALAIAEQDTVFENRRFVAYRR